MTGQELYQRYADALADEGVAIDEWDKLDEHDKRAWNRVAEEL